MPEPCLTQATSLTGSILELLGKMVWPVFIWLLLLRKSINGYIRTLLEIAKRTKSFKVPGVEIILVEEEWEPLPDPTEEKEHRLTRP